MKIKRAFLLNDKWALAYDEKQWIIQCRRIINGRHKWKNVRFVASNKVVLRRILDELGVQVTPKADIALVATPNRFCDWFAHQEFTQKGGRAK